MAFIRFLYNNYDLFDDERVQLWSKSLYWPIGATIRKSRIILNAPSEYVENLDFVS